MTEKNSEDQDKQSRASPSSEQESKSDERNSGASGEAGKIPDDDYQAIPPGFN